MATFGWVTELEADNYFALSYTGAELWDNTTNKQAALETAYRQLIACGYFNFPTITTVAVKRAQLEQALFIIRHDRALDQRTDLQAQGVVRSDVIGEYYQWRGVAIAPLAVSGLKAYTIEGKGFFGTFDLTRNDCKSAHISSDITPEVEPVVDGSELLTFSGQFNGVQSVITADGNEIVYDINGEHENYLIESIQITHADNFDADGTTKVRVSTGSVEADSAVYGTASVDSDETSGTLVNLGIPVANGATVYAYISQAFNHQDVQFTIKIRSV